MPNKEKDDKAYIKYGEGGNKLTRWWETLERDWNAPENAETVEDLKDFGTVIESQLPIIVIVKRPGGFNSSRAYPEDFPTKNTKNTSAYFKSEREARNLARQRLGRDPVEVSPNKWRSQNGKWQYRAKPGDLNERHIHIEELNPNTGEVLQNIHLRW